MGSHRIPLASFSDHPRVILASFPALMAAKLKEMEGLAEVRESRLGDFLCYVNTLSATHEAIRAVLASDMWFGTLLKIVDVDTTSGEEEP